MSESFDIYVLPPRSYPPPIATRGPRLATRGRELLRSSLGFRGALWGFLRALWGWKIPNSYQILFATREASRVLIATRYPASPPPMSYPSYRFCDMFATVSSPAPALALMPPHIMQAAYMRPPAPARLLTAEYRHHGCPSPRRTWWRRNATVQVGVALAPHGLTVPSEAGTA
eukprot:scaffold4238_cov105-Isochrysis_galbana.AAC.2